MTTRTITVSQETLKEAMYALLQRERDYREKADDLDDQEWREWADTAQRAYDELIRASVNGEGDE